MCVEKKTFNSKNNTCERELNKFTIDYLLKKKYFHSIKRKINFNEFNKHIKDEETPLNHSFLIIYTYVNFLIMEVLNEKGFIKEECYNDNILYELTNIFATEFRKIFLSAVTYEYGVYCTAFGHPNSVESQISFVSETTNNNEWLIYFFESYPELKRITSLLIKNHIINIKDIIVKYKTDKDIIFNKFDISEKLKITSITTNLGDYHNNGKTTCRIAFNSSNAIYLKYRNLSTDIFFNEFIDFLELKGLKKTIKQTVIIDCNSYGWQKEVSTKEVNSLKGIEDFYFNQGVNLSIAYLLNLEDLIADNIIAHRDLAVFFDLEMLLTPKFKRKKDYINNSEASIIFNQSIIKTGLVPILGFETFNEEGFSNSGLSKVSGNRTEMLTNKIGGKLHLQNVNIEYKDNNLPKYKGKSYELDKFCAQVESGFEFGYKFLISNKLDIARKFTELLSKHSLNVRVLLRYTYIYSKLKQQSYSYQHSINNISYTKLLKKLWRGEDSFILNSNVIESEIEQLINNDIPYFNCCTNSKDLYTNNKLVSKSYFSLTGLDNFKKKLEKLSMEDLLMQKSILRRAMIIHNNYNTTLVIKNKNLIEQKKPIDSVLKGIADYIEDINFDTKNKNYFSYIDFIVTKGGLWDQGVQHQSIFQGTEGLSLFFSAYYKKTGHEKYLKHASTIISQSIEGIIENKKNFLQLPKPKIGLTNQPISTLYSLMLNNKILEHSHFKLPEEVYDFTKKYILSKYKDEQYFCFLSGGTGLVLLLFELYQQNYDEDLKNICIKIARNIIRKSHVVDNERLTWKRKSYDKWGGFAHGNSSTSYMLFKLCFEWGIDEFYVPAIKSLQYDQSLFDNQEYIWRKSLDFKGDIHYGWATGSAGIGLSRKLISKYYQNDFMLKEIEIAKHHIIESIDKTITIDNSICSGFMGMYETASILGINQKVLDSKMMSFLEQTTNYDNIKCGGWDKQQLLSGLYYGISGVGYNLMKLTGGDNLPSLLYL